jgi:hypothetical protein
MNQGAALISEEITALKKTSDAVLDRVRIIEGEASQAGAMIADARKTGEANQDAVAEILSLVENFTLEE